MIFNPDSTEWSNSLETAPETGPTGGKPGVDERSRVADTEIRVCEGVDGVVTFDITELQVLKHQFIFNYSLYMSLFSLLHIHIQAVSEPI